MTTSDEREGLADEPEATTDDVEGHGPLGDRPPADRPPADRADEGDDVEAHVLSEQPPSD